MPVSRHYSKDAQISGQDKVNAMASSMRHEMPPQQMTDDDITAPEEDTTLDLGHARIACECWSGAQRAGCGTRSNVKETLRRPALRLRSPTRLRMRHGPRPSQPAEARFTPSDAQFLNEVA